MIATDEAGAAVAHEAALQISAMGAQWLTREDVPADVLESERRVATEKTTEELKSKGKPEAVIEKIAPKLVVQGSRGNRAFLRSCGGRQGRRRVNLM